MLGIEADEFGFYNTDDAEMTPVESRVRGIYLAGAGLGPQDIPETVAQASGAAAKVLSMFQAAEAAERARKALEEEAGPVGIAEAV
jgi:heterodisulfide reductase subunit A